MFEEPELFSAVGRAQLVSDFCYFYANDKVDNGTILKEAVVDMVRFKIHFNSSRKLVKYHNLS